MAATRSKGIRRVVLPNFMEHFGVDVDCYVLKDTTKTAVISQRGMGQAIGLSQRGDRLTSFVNSKTMADYIGRELRQKLENPIVFQWSKVAAASGISAKANGYEASVLMAAAVGVEPTTLRFEAERSVQLSYAAECLRLPPTLLEKSAHGQNP